MLGVGDRVGGHTIVAKLTSGGMATLFLGRSAGPNGATRSVALKVVLPHLTADSRFAGMLAAEAAISMRIRHPNVVHVEELLDHGGEHVLVMEYLDGCSLAELLQRLGNEGLGMSPAHATFIAMQVAEGLHAAHETSDDTGTLLGVVHRDVSPQNVILSRDGAVKVIDFGIAKARGAPKTADGALRGKLRYMSPEQAWERPVDRRTDIFSLGVVLWEALTMRRMISSRAELGEVLLQVRDPTIVAPSRHVAGIPEALDRAVLQALEPDPDRRPATARAFRELLADALPAALAIGPEQLATLLRDAMGDALGHAPELAMTDTRSVEVPAARDTARETLPREADAEDASPRAPGLLRRAEALRFLGRREEQGLELAIAADAAVDDLEKAAVLREQAIWVHRTHGPRAALPQARAALEAADRTGDASTIARALVELADVLVNVGDVSDARILLDRAEQLEVTPFESALLASVRAAAATSEGDVGGALAHFGVALAGLAEVGDHRRAVIAETNMADFSNRLGRYEEAIERLRAALRRSEAVGNLLAEGYVHVNMAFALCELGRSDEASRSLDAAARWLESTADARLQTAVDVYRARIALAEHQSARAVQLATAALRRAEEVGFPDLEAYARTHLARGLLELGDIAGALVHARRAMTLRDALGGLPEGEAEVFLALERCLRASGDLVAARSARTAGRARVRQLASRIADPAARRDFVGRVAAHRELLDPRDAVG